MALQRILERRYGFWEIVVFTETRQIASILENCVIFFMVSKQSYTRILHLHWGPTSEDSKRTCFWCFGMLFSWDLGNRCCVQAWSWGEGTTPYLSDQSIGHTAFLQVLGVSSVSLSSFYFNFSSFSSFSSFFLVKKGAFPFLPLSPSLQIFPGLLLFCLPFLSFFVLAPYERDTSSKTI